MWGKGKKGKKGKKRKKKKIYEKITVLSPHFFRVFVN
jgi:hypothetical protein